jgi:putative NIF3 family GTP cyclohydrolase 1 type 2
MDRAELVNYLDSYLRIGDIADYGPQGLQVETANTSVNRIALAVDVSPTIIETAVSYQADMLLVHHGVLWRQVERIAGPLGERVRQMMAHGLNLYAAHLPLDAHPEVGNNAVLARLCGVSNPTGGIHLPTCPSPWLGTCPPGPAWTTWCATSTPS